MAVSKKAVKANVDFQLLDNGTAKASIAEVDDAAGLPTTLPAGVIPKWTSSDPAVVIDATGDPTGMSVIVKPATPPVLKNGIIITATATLADGSTVTGSGNPIDVVGGPAKTFKIQEQ